MKKINVLTPARHLVTLEAMRSFEAKIQASRKRIGELQAKIVANTYVTVSRKNIALLEERIANWEKVLRVNAR